ncbi:hypothetical protein [Sporosarcina sp. YIM B06819]|uniref:hypothetical protein n=1 Tax=Sporosarcina sp. YIM B06819 TaxID=3081769 RepID=UPI00298C4976|nr:hypothetical protein [Sporosarcina sp. YIM B06819]
MLKKSAPIFGSDLKNAVKAWAITLKGRVVSGAYNQVIFEDSTTLEVENVIPATGF